MEFISKTGIQSRLYDISAIEESAEWQQWLQDVGYSPLCRMVQQAYTLYTSDNSSLPSGIAIGERNGSGAFTLHGPNLSVSFETLQYFQLYIKKVLQDSGYIVNLREEKTGSRREMNYIIYQKPSFKLPTIDGKADQLFGNVYIDVKTDASHLTPILQLTVHRYRDFRFNEGRPFSDLITLLTQEL